MPGDLAARLVLRSPVKQTGQKPGRHLEAGSLELKSDECGTSIPMLRGRGAGAEDHQSFIVFQTVTRFDGITHRIGCVTRITKRQLCHLWP